MAADNEYRLVSKVISDRNILPVMERGIQDDWIIDDDLRRVWKFVREHYSNYREVPTIIAVTDHFPNFKCLKVEDTLDYLIDTMVDFRRNMLTRNGIQDTVTLMAQNNHEAALSEMSKIVQLVNTQGSIGTNHVDITKDPDKFWDEYENVQNAKMIGVPTGFAKIDEATAGLQGGQLITLIAPPKTGKSQIGLRIAANIHESGLVPLFQSFEMNNHEQTQRYMSMGAHISNGRLRRGKLQADEEDRLISFIDDLKERKPFHFVDAVNGLTVDALVAKAEQLRPDILFVDGVYLMLDQVTGEANTPQALTNITRALKRVAQKLNIPIIITTQTLLWKMKGNKVSADSIGYSSSFFQDSDVILGLEPVEEDDTIRILKVVQARNCPPSETSITWNWDTGCFHDESSASSCKFCSPFGASRAY
jgi:KaiC/GvpD/RAD55 family RecA-like ATPase